jgi:hypothetical protein
MNKYLWSQKDLIPITNSDLVDLNAVVNDVYEKLNRQAGDDIWYRKVLKVELKITLTTRQDQQFIEVQYVLTKPIKWLLWATVVFQTSLFVVLLALFFNGIISSAHPFYKFIYIIPVLLFLGLLVFIADFQDQCRQMSGFIRSINEFKGEGNSYGS